MPPPYPTKRQERSARSRLRASRRVESAPSPMKKDPDHNSTDPAEIEALIARLERGQLREGDAQLLGRLLRLLLRLIILLQSMSQATLIAYLIRNSCKRSMPVPGYAVN